MSLRKKIACGVLLGAVIGVGALTVWQWNNISAALSFARFSQEELEEKLAANDQTIKDAVTRNPQVTIREVTQEERAALRDGTLTREELVQSLLQPSQSSGQETQQEKTPAKQPEKQPEGEMSDPGTRQTTPDPSPPGTEQSAPEQTQAPPAQSEYEQKMNALVAEVLVLREEFLIKLDELQAEAIAAYKAIPADQRTTSRIASLVSSYLSKGLAMEKECDAEIEHIVVELEQLLTQNGGDLNLAQEVYDTYLEEKSLKKAWYMAELKKRGMV